MENNMNDRISTEIQRLEEYLLTPNTRKSPQELVRLLADDFTEISSLGASYTRQEIIDALQVEPAAVEWSLYDFSFRLLSPEIVLSCYLAKKTNKLTGHSDLSSRSSIWKNEAGEWQMLFHQGTLFKLEA
jgi:hypothetical protein